MTKRHLWATVSITLSCAASSQAAETVPVARIAKFDGDRAAAISYTFDDGLRDQYTLAVPMLNEVGFKGTFFIIPNSTPETLEDARKNDDKKRAWGGITWSELKEMAAQGHEIGSHTWSHRNLKNLSADEVEAEFTNANEAIQAHLGQATLTLAFPFNASTPEIQATALRHYVAYRAYQTATSGGTTAESLNTWADKLVKDGKWGVIMTHAVAKGYAAVSDAEVFRAHFMYVKSREADIWGDTFANISRYEKEREDATLKITGGTSQATCVLQGTLDVQLYNVPLTIVLEVAGVKSASAERAGQELPARVQNGHIYVQAAPSAQPITITWK